MNNKLTNMGMRGLHVSFSEVVERPGFKLLHRGPENVKGGTGIGFMAKPIPL